MSAMGKFRPKLAENAYTSGFSTKNGTAYVSDLDFRRKAESSSVVPFDFIETCLIFIWRKHISPYCETVLGC